MILSDNLKTNLEILYQERNKLIYDFDKVLPENLKKYYEIQDKIVALEQCI